MYIKYNIKNIGIRESVAAAPSTLLGWIIHVHGTDSTYSPINEIEQPIDRIDIETTTLNKHLTSRKFYKYVYFAHLFSINST